MNLKECSLDFIIDGVKNGKITKADFIDSGICPTCFNREHNNIIYGSNIDKILYEDECLECFLASDPRAIGHTIISTKKHFKDMLELDDETCKRIFLFSKIIMNILKEVYDSESVYLCTMCDGLMNHFHVQLIPRYYYEERGSKNFVKPRMEYVNDSLKVLKLREKINKEYINK